MDEKNETLDDFFVTKQVAYQFQFNTNIIIIWSSIFAIGLIFETLYWPFYTVFKMIGSAGFMAYNLSAIIRLKAKNYLNNGFCILSIFWITYILLGIMVDGGNPFSKYGLLFLSIFFVVIFILNEIVFKIRQKVYNSKFKMNSSIDEI